MNVQYIEQQHYIGFCFWQDVFWALSYGNNSENTFKNEWPLVSNVWPTDNRFCMPASGNLQYNRLVLVGYSCTVTVYFVCMWCGFMWTKLGFLSKVVIFVANEEVSTIVHTRLRVNALQSAVRPMSCVNSQYAAVLLKADMMTVTRYGYYLWLPVYSLRCPAEAWWCNGWREVGEDASGHMRSAFLSSCSCVSDWVQLQGLQYRCKMSWSCRLHSLSLQRVSSCM